MKLRIRFLYRRSLGIERPETPCAVKTATSKASHAHAARVCSEQFLEHSAPKHRSRVQYNQSSVAIDSQGPKDRPRRLKVWLRSSVLVVLAMLLVGVSSFAFLWVRFPFPFERLERWPASPTVTDRNGRLLSQRVADDDQWRDPICLDEISPWLINATIAAEDERFRSHPGVDVIAVGRSIIQNISAGRVVSGASTISMQVCRMVDPRPRCIDAKLIEAVRSIQLEKRYSKDDILETYLNLAPYGGNLRGVEVAARRYFGKRCADLSLSEAALLAGLPQAPTRFRPDRHLEEALVRRRYVLRRMAELGMINAKQQRAAEVDPVELVVQTRHHTASHAVSLALQRRKSGGRTTICIELQQCIETAVNEHVEFVPADADIAVVVIDISNGDIVALVGSSDCADPNSGQVNGAIARRSPGSALKPFIYAAAFETQRLGPASLLVDRTIERAGGWSPQNFDRRYFGTITSADALRLSRNVPAILVTEAVGLSRCLGTIEAVGIRLPSDSLRRGGSAIAVGGIEVTLLDLTNGYATLGRLGKFMPVRLYCDEPTHSAQSLDTATCAAINEILSSRNRRPFSIVDGGPGSLPWFTWKTGTSSGRRDAWAVGHNHRFAIGVWVGKFAGGGHPDLVGRKVAEPLLARMFAHPRLRNDEDPDKPQQWKVIGRPLLQAAADSHVSILSPVDGDVFLCQHGLVAVDPKVNQTTPLNWFLNGKYYERNHDAPFMLAPGSYELRCVAQNGRSSAVRFRVE